jgi:hypothetical protein
LDYVVFDFETGGLDPNHNEAIQVAGKAYNARTLEPYPAEQGGEFCSLMKPLYPDRLEDGALKVNKKTREELMVAPDQGVVWNQFVDWVGRWNPKKTKWTAPIACGKNIRGFDLKFVTVLNNLHCKKKDKTVLFSERREVDMQDFTFAWFENEAEPEDDKMDTWRKYFGLSRGRSRRARRRPSNGGRHHEVPEAAPPAPVAEGQGREQAHQVQGGLSGPRDLRGLSLAMPSKKRSAKNQEKIREYMRKWRANNREKCRQYTKKSAPAYRRKRKQWLADFKSKRGCGKCGFKHPACLEFHHKNRDTKVAEVSVMLRQGVPKPIIMKEIRKCKLLCANCHRIEHWEELQKDGI